MAHKLPIIVAKKTNESQVANCSQIIVSPFHVVCGICMLEERVYQQKIHGRAIGSSVSEVIVNLVRKDNEQ